MTATFDRHDTGTPARDWDRTLSALTPLQATAGRLVVLAAHPDDESLGAGGLLAASAALGARITVVIATDGEHSHPDSPTVDACALATRRRVEVQSAVARLAPGASVCCLGLPDSGLAGHADTLDAALHAVFDTDPGTDDEPVRLVAPWHADRHPDHEACARAAARLAAERNLELWEYPIWAWHWARPESTDLPWARLRRLDLAPEHRVAKQAAIAEYVSQLHPLSDRPGDEAVLAPEMLEHFDRPSESFVVTAPATRARYFDALYEADEDPWGLAERFYERRKRSVLMAALPRARFRRAFEPGCAIGLLTAELAERCDELIAWDVADAAVRRTTERLMELDDVRASVERNTIPEHWPDGRFDLIVLSEVGYYVDDLDALRERVLASLAPDGVVVGCHWRHPAPDHPRTAGDVHRLFDEVLERDVHHVEDDFLLDVWSRGAPSVARAEGLQ